jgi:hypothetical protein
MDPEVELNQKKSLSNQFFDNIYSIAPDRGRVGGGI